MYSPRAPAPNREREPKSSQASVGAASATPAFRPHLVPPPAPAHEPFARVFSFGESRRGALFTALFTLMALSIHTGAVAGALVVRDYIKAHTTYEPPQEIVDVDISNVKEDPPPPAPAVTAPPPPPEPPPVPTADVAASPKAPDDSQTKDPPAAPLGQLGANLLATDVDKNDPSTKDDPYVFSTDPDGKEFSGGTSGVGGGPLPGVPGGKAYGVPGGTGSGIPAQGALATAPPPPPPPAVNLSKKAGFAGSPSACQGFFPAEADDDAGSVQLLVMVSASGEVSTASVMSENPKGQGFGRAARSCVLGKKLYSPALDAGGNAVGTQTTLNIAFTRN